MLQPLTDTLTCDSKLLHRFRSDEAYDYAGELQTPDLDWWDWLARKIERLLSDVFSIQSDGDIRIFIYIAIALAFSALIVFLLYRHRPGLFGKAGNINRAYARAMAQKDYYRAVRIVYLRTLRRLSDNQRISWQLYKTPTEYTREFLSADFQRMTSVFMRVRYGNYPASEELVDLLVSLEDEIRKGGAA